MNLCSIEPIADSNVEIGRSIVKLRTQSGDVKEYYFSNVFNGVDSSKFECMIPLLNAFLSGENACIIAHGETGIYFFHYVIYSPLLLLNIFENNLVIDRKWQIDEHVWAAPHINC